MDGAPPVLEAVAAAKRNGVVPKAAVQKKATVKPKKPQEVIEINSDTDEDDVVNKQEKPVVNRKKDGEGPSKKKAPTLTSVLTVRSKVYICYAFSLVFFFFYFFSMLVHVPELFYAI